MYDLFTCDLISVLPTPITDGPALLPSGPASSRGFLFLAPPSAAKAAWSASFLRNSSCSRSCACRHMAIRWHFSRTISQNLTHHFWPFKKLPNFSYQPSYNPKQLLRNLVKHPYFLTNNNRETDSYQSLFFHEQNVKKSRQVAYFRPNTTLLTSLAIFFNLVCSGSSGRLRLFKKSTLHQLHLPTTCQTIDKSEERDQHH